MHKTIIQKTLSVLVVLLLASGTNLIAQQLPIDTTKGWEMTWHDEFDYEDKELDEKWESQNGPSGHILCSRWRENAVVKDGILELQARKENRGGQEWTAGNIWTKKKFKYGYFECRYKYAGANGTNNSFWLMTRGSTPTVGEKFEIDINEGHFPNEVNTNIHNWGAVHTPDSRSFSFGIEPGVSIPLEIPITTKKIRFSSNNGAHFHIREFRIYKDNDRNFPNVMSESADTDVSGLVNHSRAAGTKITSSGILDKAGLDTKPEYVADGTINTSWVSQKDGQKWLEFEWTEDKTVGCIQFINGWKSGDKWNALISDYKVEYWNGSEWVEMASLNLTEDDTFADVYHTYGLLWDENQIVFYFDGKEIRREKNEFCLSEAPIWLSLAIIEWDGEVTDAIDGTSMKIDYVRVYNKKNTSSVENVNQRTITTFPNPVKEKLFFENTKPNSSIQVYSIQGKKLIDSRLNANFIDVSFLKSGMYVYVLDNSQTINKGTFLKN